MHNEKVFTPSWMVKLMLDKVQYSGDGILRRHFMDNSCGEGAFLVEAVERYCKVYQAKYGNLTPPLKILKHDLETYIHGIEIDDMCANITRINLNKVGLKYGLTDVNWDIKTDDALTNHSYDGLMDYVVGNPPYVNVHDFGNKYELFKSFKFSDKGMTDLYLIFFEVGFNMLSDNGKLIYITPSSWTTSIAASSFRKWLIDNDYLSDVVIICHDKIFKKATTFTIITELVKNKDKYEKGRISLYRYNPSTVDFDYICNRPLNIFTISNKFYFMDDTDAMNELREVEKHQYKDVIKVKNGFATLNDKLFITDYDEKESGNDCLPLNTIRAIKSTTGEWKTMLFPYDLKHENKPIEFDDLSEWAKNYLRKRCRQLHMEEEGKTKGKWWLYGRSQAINDIGRPNRYSFRNLLRDDTDVLICPLDKNDGVYGGLYFIADRDAFNLDVGDDFYYFFRSGFTSYLKALGHYKNGGYYAISSKELQNWMNYKYSKRYE